MRKKSHVSLARFIVRNTDNEELKKHRYSFYIGSILPDIKPSFVYRKHEIDGTFPDLQERMKKMLERIPGKEKYTRRDICRMGEISHYLADYFTFPHNKEYPGSLKDHCTYEEELKQKLRMYLNTHEAKENLRPKKFFASTESLFEFINRSHREYLDGKHGVRHDIESIVEVNHQALEGFFDLLKRKEHKKRYIDTTGKNLHHGAA